MKHRAMVAVEAGGAWLAAVRWLGLLAIATIGMDVIASLSGCAGSAATATRAASFARATADADRSAPVEASGPRVSDEGARGGADPAAAGAPGTRRPALANMSRDALMAALVTGWPTTTAADIVDPTQRLAPASLDLARELYRDGLSLYEAEDYEGALAHFEDAYATAPVWRMRYNLASLHRELGHAGDARRELLAYLDEGGDDVPADRRLETERALSELGSATP